jgi:type IV secretory pathway VirB2 component (pilin)
MTSRSNNLLKHVVANIVAPSPTVLPVLLGVVLLAALMPQHAHAQSTGGGAFNLPVVDQLLCGFIAYSRGKLAAMIAVAVVVITIIGHWLGHAKIWATLMYVGIGFGVIQGIGSYFANYGALSQQCIG